MEGVVDEVIGYESEKRDKDEEKGSWVGNS